MLCAMPRKSLELPNPLKRRLLHLRILSGTETPPVLSGPEVRNCMRLLEMPLGDGVLALLANGDSRTLRMDPRLTHVPQYTREAHGAGLPRGLLCLGKLPNHYFAVPPSGAYVHLHPIDDAESRQLPLEQWLDEQIAILIEQLRDVETEEKARVFHTINEEELAAFAPGVELSAEGSRTVTHAKFGEGEVLREVDGGTKLEVRFGDGQVRMLLARFVQGPGVSS